MMGDFSYPLKPPVFVMTQFNFAPPLLRLVIVFMAIAVPAAAKANHLDIDRAMVTAQAQLQPQPRKPIRVAAGPANATTQAQHGHESISTEQLLYQYLLAEIAGQRGGSVVAARGMLDLAQKTRDLRIARRAAEIAFQSRQMTEARDSLLLWIELEPDSVMGRQALGALVGVQGPIEPLVETLRQWLKEKTVAPPLFLQVPYLLSRYADRERSANIVVELALPYSSLPEAQYAVAMTAFAVGRIDAARIAIDAALTLKPDFGRAAMAKTQMILAGGGATAPEQARQFIEQFLKKFDDDTEVRIAYARLLVGAKSLLSAREEFRRAIIARPSDGELVYAVALISLQIEDWDSAIVGFTKTLTMYPRDKNPIYFNLGVAFEGKKDPDVAVAWYGRITEGEYFVNAQLKVAKHLAKRDGLAAGRKSLLNARSGEYESAETKTQLFLAEAQLLRDSGSVKEAYDVLSDALAKQPESVALRYDRAMLADRLNMLEELERDLRTVMSIKPDHAHAYNALGYTFAERGIRLNEALALINKAVSLAPDDAFILDSLGWVQFRLNQTDAALATLTRAYAMRADPEIAAHLGEVLWTKGSRQEAMQIWQRALIESPDNAALQAVLQRFK